MDKMFLNLKKGLVNHSFVSKRVGALKFFAIVSQIIYPYYTPKKFRTIQFHSFLNVFE